MCCGERKEMRKCMDDRIRQTIEEYCDSELTQIIISNSSRPEEMKKVTVRPVLIKKELLFQASEYRGTKVFHENYTKEQLLDKLPDWLEHCLKQLELKSKRASVTVLISKKGTTTIKCKKLAGVKGAESETTAKSIKAGAAEQADGQQPEQGSYAQLAHNRTKRYIIEEGTQVPFLVDLGIMTLDGKIVRTRYDKFRQINRFLECIEDILPELPQEEEISILDFGCGKSYLTFARYYYLHELKGYRIRVTGLDLKADVIEHCNRLAERYGYDKLKFLQGDIASYEGCSRIDMVVTLHACDTATDYALEKAIGWGARVILSVPCCQHELNRTIANEMLAPVLKYGLIKERMAALITDALRAELLELAGYRVQILEFIDMEHTPKNILIRAVKKHTITAAKFKQEKRKQYERCIGELQVMPTLYRDLYQDRGELPTEQDEGKE